MGDTRVFTYTCASLALATSPNYVCTDIHIPPRHRTRASHYLSSSFKRKHVQIVKDQTSIVK